MKKPGPSVRKVLSSIKGSIRRGSFKVGQCMDSKTRIAERTRTSMYAVNKAVSILQGEGIVEDQGYLGVWVISPIRPTKNSISRKLNMLGKVSNNLKAAKMLNEGGTFVPSRQAVVSGDEKYVHIFFPLSGNLTSFFKEEIELYHHGKILPEDVLAEPGLRPEYLRQKEIEEYLDLIIPNRKSLGLDI